MPLRSDTVYLHSFDLDIDRNACSQSWNLLDDAERLRASRFRSRALRRKWAVARAALRSILAGYCDCSPHKIKFSKGAFGKPALAGECAKTGVTFNLSHSGDMAVIAVANDLQLGVDIELRKTVRDWVNIANRFFSASENSELMSFQKCRRTDAFFDCWTRKEAIIKATGEGLSARLRDFDVSLAPGSSSRVLADYSDEQKYIGWRLKNLDFGRRFSGAVATPVARDLRYRDQGNWSFEHA